LRIGVGVKASKHFSAYLQMQDAHALALPLRFVASNVRDTLTSDSLTCGWTFRKPHFSGKARVAFGDERLIGISDWTNTSRTFDVIRTVIAILKIALISSVDRWCRSSERIGY